MFHSRREASGRHYKSVYSTLWLSSMEALMVLLE